MTRVANPSRRHAIERHVVEHRTPAPFGGRRAGRKLRRLAAVRKRSQRVRREEARIGLLELLDEIQIQRRRRACASMADDGAERLLPNSARVSASTSIQRRRVHRGWRPRLKMTPSGSIVHQNHAPRQRSDPDRRVLVIRLVPAARHRRDHREGRAGRSARPARPASGVNVPVFRLWHRGRCGHCHQMTHIEERRPS